MKHAIQEVNKHQNTRQVVRKPTGYDVAVLRPITEQYDNTTLS